ncbi:MAG: signal recognition particle-docking protein FtsY [Desulfobacteraceae bacterium]|nr:signal recognition particle-docking protein FtsY [Desulfobacteraceae bacterium]MDD3991587.1 signal recognition particle-docking protein FtsY [Desulfobacteraceae bacterium]
MAFNWFRKEKEKTPDKPTEATDMEPVVEPSPPPVPAEKPVAPGGGWFSRLKHGLSKTRDFLNTDIEDLFSGHRQIDDEMLEDLEAMLIMADIGAGTAAALVDDVRRKGDRIKDADGLRKALKAEIRALLQPPAAPAAPPAAKPRVIMVVGVNGVGKTTTIGKLAARARQEGRQVLVAAADTFRAAAIEQLAVWTQRAGVELVRHKPNADPAAVAFDGVAAAMARGLDEVFIDTAGRLHTNVNLMEELKKIQRTIAKQLPGAPHEVLLVMDATTGQNGLNQARLFHEALGVTGIALTKLDGTAKGGIVVSICQSLGLPLRYVGVGEQIQDLQPFDPAAFAEALF